MTLKSLQPRSYGHSMLRFSYVWDPEEDGEMQGYWSANGLNISQDDHHVFVEVDMPGLQLADIHYTLEGNRVIIRGKRQDVKESKPYFFSVELPVKIDQTHKPKAVYEDGILQLNLKKAL